MSAPFSPASRRHHQLARRELALLLKELEKSCAGVPEGATALDTPVGHSAAMRRFLGF